MRTSFVFAIGLWGLILSQGQLQAQLAKGSLDLNAKITSVHPENLKKVKSRRARPVFLSIALSAERMQFHGIKLVARFSNPNHKTISGATYTIDRWNGTG